jgi:hypothetical protein
MKAKKPNSDKVAMKLGLPVESASSTKKVKCPTPLQLGEGEYVDMDNAPN